MKKIYLLFVGMLISIGLSAQDYSQIYIVGNATPAEWDNNAAQALTLVEGSDAVYEWSGQLKVGEFKFLNNLGTWDNCFNPVETGDVVLGATVNLMFKGADNKFLVTTPGIYTVTVDMKHLTCVVIEKVVVLPTELWMSGTAIPGGKLKMSALPSGEKTKMRYIGELKEGAFSIASKETAGAGTEFFCPTLNGVDVLGLTTTNLGTGATGSWAVGTPSTLYKITVDMFNKTMNAEIFQPWENLYIVGGATSVGWDAGLALPLVKDAVNPAIFVFEGELRVAESGEDRNKFKLLGQLDWGSNSLHPYSADEPIIGSINVLANSGDDKWIINDAEQGNYRITVNTFTETIASIYLDGQSSVGKELDGKSVQVLSSNGCVELVSNDVLSNVQLIDLTGKTVAESKNGTTVSLGENVAAGIYFVKYSVNNNAFVQKVLVK